MLKTIVVAAAVLGSFVATIEPAAAQTVRRHLHCAVVPSLGLSGNVFGINVTTAVQVTNNWSQTIPRGTTYSYRINSRYYTYKSQQALPANGKLLVGDARGASACTDVWIPG
jgi:hypothetical protein